MCDDEWDLTDGNVVCRELGYPEATRVYTAAKFGVGFGEILLDNVRCSGSEQSLLECPHNGYGNHNCKHNEDAGVQCAPNGKESCDPVSHTARKVSKMILRSMPKCDSKVHCQR